MECNLIRDDETLYHELKAEKYELRKSGKILFNHIQGAHDDRFWALAIAVYASEQAPNLPSTPLPEPYRWEDKGKINVGIFTQS